jgi:hypothetical protein
LNGCIKTFSPSKSDKNVEKITEYHEDLSVFVPKYSEEVPIETVIEKKETISQSSNSKGLLKNSDTAAVDEILKKIAEANSQIKEGQGFRIQVFSGNVKSDFENAKSYLYRFHSNLEIYESFSQPTYKIVVGDFLTRADAENSLNVLKSRFESARIISDKINVKKAFENK